MLSSWFSSGWRPRPEPSTGPTERQGRRPRREDELSGDLGRTDSGRTTLLVLSLVSGLGGVVYEVLYMRHLTTVLGDMFYVHAALICMFLFGNGLGAWLAHRFTRWLFAFEIAIGVYAFVLPWLLPLYEVSPLAHLSASPVVQTLLASALLLAVPAICIGFSIPLFSAYIRGRGETRDAFKRVYLLYNLGAAASVLAVEFYLIRWVGLTVSLYVVGVANLGCGLTLWLERRAWLPAEEAPAAEPGRFQPRTLPALLCASLGASLFIAFYIKVCYHLFLPHRENFAVCTSASLLAISLGAWLARRSALPFSAFVAAAMASVSVLYGGFDWVAQAFEQVFTAAPASWATAVEFGFAFVLCLPYAFLGATIPALLRDETQVARRSGLLLLVSGIGNVLGMLLFIFVLHPLIPLFWTLLAVLGLLGIAVLLRFGGDRVRERGARARVLAPLAVALALAPVLAGRPDESVYLIHDQTPADATITHYKAASDNVSLIDSPERVYISYNGHPSIYVENHGTVNFAEVVSGVIPALVAPSRDRALVLGLGSGITAGATSRLFAHTDVVEINSGFFPLLPRISRDNFSIGENTAATIIHDDARSYLASTTKRYQAIVNSIPSPTYFAAGKIYTQEFFRMVAEALAPGGVYCSWFAPLEMSPEGLQTFLATLSHEFRHCNLAALRDGYYFTSCADEPLSVTDPATAGLPARIREALGAAIHGVTVERYLRGIFLTDDMFREMSFEGTRRNTDDFPIMEFQIMRRDRERRRPTRPPDPVVEDPQRFNVRGLGREPEELLLDRAIVFVQVHRGLFDAFYLPRLESDPALAAAFNARMDATFGSTPTQ